MKLLKCKICGALFDKEQNVKRRDYNVGTITIQCPYCHSEMVMSGATKPPRGGAK